MLKFYETNRTIPELWDKGDKFISWDDARMYPASGHEYSVYFDLRSRNGAGRKYFTEVEAFDAPMLAVLRERAETQWAKLEAQAVEMRQRADTAKMDLEFWEALIEGQR